MHGWRLNQAAVKYEQLCEGEQEGDVCKLVAQMIAQKAKKEQYPRNFDQKIRSLAKGEYDTLSRKMTYAKSRSKKEEDKRKKSSEKHRPQQQNNQALQMRVTRKASRL